MKKLLVVIIVASVIAGLYLISKPGPVEVKGPGDESTAFRPNPSNATFLFDDGPVTLSRGRNERVIEPSLALTEETFLAEDIGYGDLNGDGRDDAAVLLIRQGGGSGLFVYVAGYVSGPNAYKGTNAVYVGDRISPKSVSIDNGVIVLQYLDRDSGEPLAAEPTLLVTKRFSMRGSELAEI